MKKARAATRDLLSAALCCGVLDWLDDASVLRVLATTRALQADADVVACALRRVTDDPQWWFRDRFLSTCAATASPIEAVRLAVQMQEIMGGVGVCENVMVHPFLTPADGQTSASATEALTVVLPIRLRLTPGGQSPFTAHWERITMSNGRSQCALCEAALAAVCAYREETEAFTDAFEDSLIKRQAEWERDGFTDSEIFEHGFDFQDAYFRNESFYSAYVASKSDAEVLDHVCDLNRFPIRLQCVCSTSEALSTRQRELCRRLYQPVKSFLCTSSCGQQPPSLSPIAQIHQDPPTPAPYDMVHTVARDGYIVGFLVSTEASLAVL